MKKLRRLLMSILYAFVTLAAVFVIFIFAGVFKKVFMSICFFLMFCCLVAVLYNINKRHKEGR